MRTAGSDVDAGSTRVALTPTSHRDYSRNVMLRSALRAAGLDVVELNADGGTLSQQWRSLWQSARHTPFDILLVTYPAHRHLPAAWALARRRRVPLVVDPLFSLYDTKIVDRREAREFSVRAAVARASDVLVSRVASRVLVDSDAHAARLSALGKRPRQHYVRIWTGTDETVMHPCGHEPDTSALHPGPGVLHAVHYGNYFPLQGVEIIIGAAALVRDLPLVITMIGEGPGRAGAERLVRDHRLANVRFVDRVPYRALHTHLCSADLVLGIFGASPKAACVVPNKVFDAACLGRPVVTADTHAARELLVDGETALLCPPGDAVALASRLRTLVADAGLRGRVARNAQRLFQDHAAASAQADAVAAVVFEAVGREPHQAATDCVPTSDRA